MADPNIVGSVPLFTSDEDAIEEVKESEGTAIPEDEPEEEGQDTPAEPPAAEEPAGNGTDEDERALRGLENERAKLLREISELKGQKRELKQAQIEKVEEKIEELKDIHPDDVSLVEKVLKAKGYITKAEAESREYERIKDAEMASFLEKYPEYKPENDPDDTNWTLLQRELEFFRLPSDPKLIGPLLEKAHRGIVRAPARDGRSQAHRAATASVGSGGAAPRTAPSKGGLTAHQKQMLRQGGWTEEEIANY